MTLTKPSTFTVQGLPPSIFRETYVVISVWKESTTWMAEYHILSKQPQEHLVTGLVEFDMKNYPPELDPIDAAYMEGEALRQAEIDLILALESRAVAAGRPELAYLPVGFKRADFSPVILWARRVFPNKIPDIVNTTKSPELKKYLQMVMSIQPIRAA
jgi:hypothetical protein